MEIKNQKTKYYYCEICKMKYYDKNKAKECKEWCSKNKTCNIDIIKYSINEKEAIKK